MLKQSIYFIKNLILLMRLKQYKSLWRKITLQYRWHNFQQSKSHRYKISLLVKYRNLLKDGVYVDVLDHGIEDILVNLNIIISPTAKIIITDQLYELALYPKNKLVIFLEAIEQNDAIKFLNKKYVDYILTPFIEKYKNIKPDNVYYFDKNAIGFYMGRFLLSLDLITFENFMQHCAELDPFSETSNICLSLPEYQNRFDYINRLTVENELSTLNFKVAVGLRHMIGWVGCGLSYKYLFTKALQRKLINITIAEDDIVLKPNFSANYLQIKNYLMSIDNWDIFNGYTFWDKNACLSLVTNFNETLLFKSNKLISTVFNIYNQTSVKIGTKWDDSYRNQDNAIDGYLKNNLSSILVSYPFIVDHNDSLDSVLWGNNNKFIYSNMANESNLVIKNVINSK